MNKDERKYVAKRIADEAQLACQQVTSNVPQADTAFRDQFKDLSPTAAFELFELNLPLTTRESKKALSMEVKTGVSCTGRYINGRMTDSVYKDGSLKFTIKGSVLPEGFQTLEHFQKAKTRDSDRMCAVLASIAKLRIDATDQVLLGSAPEALAALGDFINAVKRLVPA